MSISSMFIDKTKSVVQTLKDAVRGGEIEIDTPTNAGAADTNTPCPFNPKK